MSTAKASAQKENKYAQGGGKTGVAIPK